METTITFKINSYWTPQGLIIECPSPAAREFVARTLEDEPLIVRVKKEPVKYSR